MPGTNVSTRVRRTSSPTALNDNGESRTGLATEVM
jgi:hypothetical protein